MALMFLFRSIGYTRNLISATDLGHISSDLAEIRLFAGFYATIWTKFGQYGEVSANFGVGSTKIGSGHSTALK
jgi:hypothetical protein